MRGIVVCAMALLSVAGCAFKEASLANVQAVPDEAAQAATQDRPDVQGKAEPGARGEQRELVRLALVSASSGDDCGSLIAESTREAAIALARLDDVVGALGVARNLPAREWDVWAGPDKPRRDVRLEVALAYVRRGDFPSAVKVLAEESPYVLLPSLVSVGREALRRGRRAEAAKAVSLAGALAAKLALRSRVQALLSVGGLQVEVGDAAGARAAAETAASLIHDGETKSYGIGPPPVLDVLRGAYDRSAARQESASYRAEDLASLAVLWGRLDEGERMQTTFQEAERLAQLPDPHWRAGALRHVAVGRARAGDIDGALQTAQNIRGHEWDVFSREQALREITHLALLKGRVDLAAAGSEGMRVSPYAGLCAVEVAASLARQGDFSRALQVAGRVSDDWSRARAVLLVAGVQAEGGDVAGAIRIADGIDLRQRPLGVDLPDAPSFSWREPGTWATNYHSELDLDLGLSARLVQQAADFSFAAMFLEQAVGRPGGRDYAAIFSDQVPTVLRSLTRAQAATGHVEEALTWAERLPPGDARVWAVIGVADAVAAGPTRPEFVHAEPPPEEYDALPGPQPWDYFEEAVRELAREQEARSAAPVDGPPAADAGD